MLSTGLYTGMACYSFYLILIVILVFGGELLSNYLNFNG